MSCGCSEDKNLLNTIKRGVVGITKAVLGIDKTPTPLLELRVRACIGHPTNNGTKLKRCPKNGAGLICLDCGCILAAKQNVKSEECPRGDWPDRPLTLAEQEEWAKRVNLRR